MNTAYEKLLSHMKQMQIGHWSNHEEQAICVDFPGIVGTYRVFARVKNEVGQFQVTGQLRLSVARGCQAAVAETIELANIRLSDAELAIDFSACELRYEAREILIGED